MEKDRKAPFPGSEIPPDSVRKQLDKILATDAFANSERLSQFLRFVVNQVLDGNGDQIKEYLVGIEAFGRPDS